MKSTLRLALVALAGTSAFFATVLGIEFLAWWWTFPSDPLADPAANAVRFAVAACLGGGAALRVLSRTRVQAGRLGHG